jgi:hypothetical protein
VNCPTCFGDRHTSTCPEMFWPDGKPRGAAPVMDPPPALTEEEKARVPASQWSPLNSELASIFSGITEAMIERHIAAQRARLRDEGGR